jgi:hypothetical protein
MDVNRYLYLYLKTLSPRTDNGDTILLHDWYDADGNYEPVGYPHGTMRRLHTADPSPTARAWEPYIYADDPVTDTVEYVPGTDLYQLAHTDVASPGLIQTVVGTVNGVAGVTIASSNWVRWGSEAGKYTHLKFLGPVRPDGGTNFAVTYRPRRLQKRKVIEAYPVWRIAMHFQDLPSGQRGATRAYTKEDLAGQALDWLRQRLILDRGKRIGPEARSLNMKGPFGNGFVKDDEAERTRIVFFDIYGFRRTIAATEDIEWITEISATGTPEL